MTEELSRTRILLVEDENYVRDVACEILKTEGYEVLSARTGKEALQLIEQSGPVQLLLTDMVMPGMNGLDLSEQLTSRHPQLKTIYMSGYNEAFGDPFPKKEITHPFLRKPFTMEGLASMVKKTLGAVST